VVVGLAAQRSLASVFAGVHCIRGARPGSPATGRSATRPRET
jgi:hypothetical protein